MSSFDWKSFLLLWSQAILDSMSDEERKQLPQQVLNSGWLGYPGATDKQITKLETRLKRQLPPSYREFLKVTNGWRQTAKDDDSFSHKLWSTDEVGGFVIRHPLWIKAFAERHETADMTLIDPDELDDCWNPIGIPDDEYFVYGEEQDPSKLRVEYLKAAIEISDVGIDSIYLLNPQVVNSEGEWEAWFFADYLPGADRYPSFREMMEAEYANFLELQAAEADEHKDMPTVSLQPILESSKHGIGILTNGDPQNTKGNMPSDVMVGTEPIIWRSRKRLIIELQSRQVNNQADYRTVVSTDDLLQSRTWPGLLDHELQCWLQQHLTVGETFRSNEVGNDPTDTISGSNASVASISSKSSAEKVILKERLLTAEESELRG